VMADGTDGRTLTVRDYNTSTNWEVLVGNTNDTYDDHYPEETFTAPEN